MSDMSPRLTPRQELVLRKLAEFVDGDPPYGVNACSFGGETASASARQLGRRGLVHIDRIGDRHLRYAITSHGLSLLRTLDDGASIASTLGNSGMKQS